ncbi:MAG: hypothetical protein PCFJNLEI_02457 [Verrucomicrobiae bacterium]|nr:hypothetical protein [Verrucomicrobiae bacterium]
MRALLLLLIVSTVGFAADPEEAQYNVVVTLYNAGQWQAAIKKIEEREKLPLPDAMRAKYLAAKGLAYEKGGKPADARVAYEALLTKYPQAPESRTARLSLVHLDYAARNFDAVIRMYPMVEKAGLPAADARNLALMYAEAVYAQGDAKAALAAYNQIGPDKSAVAGRLFELYSRLQMHKELVDISVSGVTGLDADLVGLARAESLLALGRNAEAEAQAGKIAATSALYPRAAFTRGLALIKLNKLKEAVAPLTVAVEKLKDPPPPPNAYLTLADCLLESGQPKEAEAYLAKAQKLAGQDPELQKQIALVKLRQSISGGSRKEMIATITKSRDSLPKEQLPKMLYLRLFAYSEDGDDAAIVRTMAADLPVLQASPEDGAATLIYAAALRKLKRADEGLKLLDEFVKRQPSAPEALRARLELANVALEQEEFRQAAPLLDAILNTPGAEATLGKETFQKVLFNRAVAADKLQKPDDAIMVLKLLPTGPAAVLLGQMYAVKKDYATAAATWKKALTLPGVDEADVRDRLGRVLFAAKNYAGACEQFEKLPALSRESAEAFARSRFATGRFADAAKLYEDLYSRHRDVPAYAYECAVALERDKKLPEAAKWYGIAVQAKDKLPAEYAKVVEANLALAQGDWSRSLVPTASDAEFNLALTQIRKAGKPINYANPYTVTQARYYDFCAVLLQTGSATNAGQLAAEFMANERQLDPKSTGATLAPAIIYFFKGEAERRAGNEADALVSYETVLSAYPYNEWPDAAACGAAECYAALGDKPTALAKFAQVVKANASPQWTAVAQKRITELNQGD